MSLSEQQSNKSQDNPSQLANRGDFYIASGNRVPLMQRTNQIAVVLEETGNQQDIRDLTSRGGSLEDFTVVEQYQDNQWILESDSGVNLREINQELAGLEDVQYATNVYQNPNSDSWLIATDAIIVSLNSNVDPEEFFSRDSRITEYRPLLGTPDQYIVTINQPQNILSITNSLNINSQTKWAAPDFYQQRQPFSTPNDPLYSEQWHLNNTGQGGGTPNQDVDAPEAWNINPGGSSDVVIGIIDDGMQLNHPDLLTWVNPGEIANNGIDDDGNGWVDDVNGWDFTNNDNNPGPSTADDAHATSVAGVAAARGNNNLGVTGIAYRSQVMPVRIFNGNNATTDSNIAQAIYYAAGRTANGQGTWNASQILNNSWGGGGSSTAITDAFTWASNQGRQGKGVISFIAAGNGFGSPVSYPADLADDLSGVIAVGASTNLGVRSDYSNIGPELDFVAPSSGAGYGGTLDILTTDRTGSDGYSSGDYTYDFGGTSSATPLAAGIGALILAQNPNLTAAQVRTLMRATTDQIGSGYDADGFSVEYGYGKVNAQRALSAIGIREIQVTGPTGNVADDTGVVNFSANIGSSTTRTFVVRNQGTEDLTLGNISLDSGPFSLVSGFTDTNLSLGESTSFTVRFTPTGFSRVNQSVSFTNNDPDESPFNFTLSGIGTNSYGFGNSTRVAIPATGTDGPASPYPSSINVSGLTGEIEKVTVTLNQLSHTWSGDIDILLVGPTGAKTLLMSDAGGGANLSGVTITFDPDATNSIPSDSFSSGTYLPTNNGGDDTFSSPAPGGPYDTNLDVFDGTNPNGTWNLFVYDDASADLGALQGGWDLGLELSGSDPTTVEFSASSYRAQEGTATGTIDRTIATISRSGNTNVTTTVPVVLGNPSGTATPDVDYTNNFPITVTFNPGEISKDVVLPIVADGLAESNETINLSLGTPTGATLGTRTTAVFTILNDDTVNLINGTPGNDTLNGSSSVDVINGLAGNDQLLGNGGNDTVNGGSGNDSINGAAGNDSLLGEGGVDTLNGGSEADYLNGGLSNDTYVVDNLGDRVEETSATGGVDTVDSTVNYTLSDHVEKLNLTGNLAIGGTGNNLANNITGNNASNLINGGGGNDNLIGNGGNDTLVGGAGNDTLTGDAGRDRIRFNFSSEGIDRISNFIVGEDKLEFSGGAFGLPVGNLDASRFVVGSGATDIRHRFVYNSFNGALFFDTDGSGSMSPRQMAVLPSSLNLTHNNFVII